MAQFKRFSGSESERFNSSYVGAEGELTWDPDNGLRIHDGNQSGGQQIGIRSYQNLQDLPTNLASIQSGSSNNDRQFLRYNSSTYAMEFADDFKVVPFADVNYPNGIVGDKVGDIAFTSDSIYYCHTEPNYIGTATLGSGDGYSNGAWVVLTSVPESGPVQVGQRLTDGNITSTVEEIVEGWPGYTGQRMIIRMSTNVAWHSGMTGTVLSVISSGEGVSTGNWTQFTSTGSSSSGSSSIEMASANFTAEVGKKYWVDTSTGPVTITLPALPAVGDWVSFYDAEFAWVDNAVTVDGNGNNIRVVNFATPGGGWASSASTVSLGTQGGFGPSGPLQYGFVWNGSVWSGFM